MICLLLAGFFGYVALPLFKAWTSFFDTKFSRNLCSNILKNKKYWDDELAEMKAKGLLPESDDEADKPAPKATQEAK